MSENDRHTLILQVLRTRPFATVRDLQDILQASPATIRRDIAKLHGAGQVRKVFGGIAAREHVPPERLSARPFGENRMLAVAAKRAIAAEAEKLVSDGDSIIIHGGSTCQLFAERLARRNVRIFTNSMPLAAMLSQHGSCHLTLSGGDLYREPGILFPASGAMPEFYASKFFIGAQAFGPAGSMESNPLIVREAERLLARADEVVVLADSSKFKLRARYGLVGLSRIGIVITDDGIAPEALRMLDEAGIPVIVAQVPAEGGDAA
ncbi:MAG: DeoR/GlpR family DNA-binding transcription regulator [Pseudomonadota bacterium]|jgi:DeoR family ulaG and ulaABCDEF operon transcriptional repressor